MAEATYSKDADVVDFVAAAVYASGQVVQLPDGRAGVITGLKAVAIGDTTGARVKGIHTMAKTTSMIVLDGQKLFWDAANNKVKYTGDFFVGCAVEDATEAATTVKVALNVEQKTVIELGRTSFTEEATDGLGVVKEDFGNIHTLAFDAVAEVGQAALYSADTIALAQKPIAEWWAAVYDIGDNAALDISMGLANGSHATDFDSVTEAAIFHLDGTALSILAESDDGTTEVAATDTTVDAVDDTDHFFQIDARDLADIQYYIDGVNVLPASVFKLDAATGPVMLIFHMEKTSDDTTADLRVKEAIVRTGLR